MGTFGASFYDMGDASRSWTEAPLDRPVTLYFPPGFHPVRTFFDSTVPGDPTFYFPSWVTLEFARGAFLVPTLASEPRAFDIVIGGEIRAGRHRIFANGIPDQPVPLGHVRLTSPSLREVLPEWWGARELADRPSDPRVPGQNVSALRAAIRTAWTDRWQHDPPLPPAAISLSGTYLLSETITVEGRPSPATGADFYAPGSERFVLHGDLIGPGAVVVNADTRVPAATTLRAAEKFKGFSLLALVDLPRFELSQLQLDGAGVVSTVLEVLPPGRLSCSGGKEKEVGTSVPLGMSGILRDCSFTGARHTLVRVEHYHELLDEFLLSIAPPWFSNSEALKQPNAERIDDRVGGLVLIPPRNGELPFDLAFSGCQFTMQALPDVSFARAVLVRTAQGRSIRFSQCGFHGSTAAMVHLYGGGTSFTACVFDNGRPPDPSLLSQGRAPGGVDLFLESIPRGECGPTAPPPVVHVFGSRSTSWQFLRTTDRLSFVESRDHSLIQGLVHECRHWRSDAGSLPRPEPAIYWGAIGETCALSLTGCLFRVPAGATLRNPKAGRVELGAFGGLRVFDVATRCEDGGTNVDPFVSSISAIDLAGRLFTLERRP